MSTTNKISDYWINILLLAVAIFFGNLWINHHIPDNSILIVIANTAIGIYGVAYAILGRTEGESGQQQVGSLIARFFQMLLKPGFLITIYLLMFVAASIYSSVWLVNSGDKGILHLELYPLDEQSQKEPAKLSASENEIVKKGFFTSPFGRVMVLKTKGYRDYTFELFPLAGKKILLDDVLVPKPSVWVRCFPTIINSLLDGCELLVLSGNGQDTLFRKQTKNTVGSYIIGEPQSVESAQIETWEREASAYYQNEGPAMSNTLIKWSNSNYFNDQLDLQINKEYQVQLVLIRKDSAIAKASFVVKKNDLLIDVLLKQPTAP